MGIAEADIVHGEQSISISTPSVTAWLTLRGGHLAPVEFHLPCGVVAPYSLAPWRPGEHPDLDPLLDVLRGDFWCLPFGAQPEGQDHGSVARDTWSLVHVEPGSAHLTIQAKDTGARVDKVVSLRDNQTAVFQEITIRDLEGNFSYGTHPILDLSGLPAGAARISTGAIRWASVFTAPFADPSLGERQLLTPGAQFDDLAEIPMGDGRSFDLSRYPAAPGHEDLVMITQQGDAHHLGWTAVSSPGYTWCALKDVRDFPSTVLWVSNGGRTHLPWLGRHTGRLGVEDVCSYFHEGLTASREDRLRDRGIATTRHFTTSDPVTLRTVQVVVPTPPEFGPVADLTPVDDGHIRLTDDQGTSVEASVDWTFVLRRP